MKSLGTVGSITTFQMEDSDIPKIPMPISNDILTKRTEKMRSVPYCNYCDPKHFVVYGFCKNCKRRRECPMFDEKGTMDMWDYEEYKKRWNELKEDTK